MRAKTRFLVIVAALIATGAAPPGKQGLDTAEIEELTGAKGQLDEKDSVFKVSLPRTDLQATVAGMKLPASMGLTAWAAFKSEHGHTMVMGDMVLFEDHQHMTGENPRMIFLHYYGRGKALDLARGVKGAINTQPLGCEQLKEADRDQRTRSSGQCP